MTVAQKVLQDSAQGGSSAGYSFYGKYQKCPRLFALEELLGLQSPGFKWALVQGSILHGAEEALYMKFKWPEVQEYIQKMTEALVGTEEEQHDMAYRVGEMVKAHKEKYFESDQELYDSWEFEKQIEVPLLGGLMMTGRIDKLYRVKATGTWVIGDYKSTGQGIGTAVKQAAQGDQFTLYTHAMKALHPDRRYQVVLDIMFGRMLKAGYKVDTSRTAPTVYTAVQLKQAVLGYTGVVCEVSQKVKSFLADEAPLEFLFPRNGTVCGIYGCPYQSICRRKIAGQHLTGADITYDHQKVDNLKDWSEFEVVMKEKN